MKICIFISGDLWGGAEAQVYQLVQQLLTISSHKLFVVTLNQNELYKKFSELSVETVSFNEESMSMFELVLAFRSYIKSQEINLVHCHGFKENLITGIAALTVNGVKVIRTHHGRGVVNVSRTKNLIEKVNARFFTSRLISVSNELKEYLIHLGYPAKKIETIHNGLDCRQLSVTKDRTELLKEYDIDNNTFIIGTTSRVEREKGHQYLLLATKALINKGLDVRLFIIGDGGLLEKYQGEAAKLGIDQAVIFAGFKSDAINYINMFDVFVMMSLNEGVPIAILEAMCLSKSIVSSKVGGIPEVIDSGQNGILVASEDADACAEAIYNIYQDKSFREKLESGANKKAQQYFSADMCAEKTLALYEQVMR